MSWQVARLAKQYQLPVIGIAGCLSNNCDAVYGHGIDAVFSVVPRAVSLAEAFRDAAINVEMTARNVAAMLTIMPTNKL